MTFGLFMTPLNRVPSCTRTNTCWVSGTRPLNRTLSDTLFLYPLSWSGSGTGVGWVNPVLCDVRQVNPPTLRDLSGSSYRPTSSTQSRVSGREDRQGVRSEAFRTESNLGPTHKVVSFSVLGI